MYVLTWDYLPACVHVASCGRRIIWKEQLLPDFWNISLKTWSVSMNVSHNCLFSVRLWIKCGWLQLEAGNVYINKLPPAGKLNLMASFQTDIIQVTLLIWKPFPFLPDVLALKCKGSQNLCVALSRKKIACLQEVSSPRTGTLIFKQKWTTHAHLCILAPIRPARTVSDERCWELKHLAF